MTIDEAINRCITELPLSTNTVRTYRQGMNRFIEFLQEQDIDVLQPVDDLNIDHFIYFLTWLNSNKYSKQTTHVYATGSKAFFDWLVIAGIFRPDYADTLRYEKATSRSHRRREDKLPRWPQRNDVAKMIEAAHAQNEKSPIKERDIALIEFLASSGCRNNEAVQLRVYDIDLKHRTTVVTGKGSKERRVFFSEDAADAIRNYWTVRKSSAFDDPVFARHDRAAGQKKMKPLSTATPRNIVDKIAKIAGIDSAKFSPHYFRHAFAIKVLNETDNLALVQDLLGHANSNSTRIYAKIYPEDLQRAHNKIF